MSFRSMNIYTNSWYVILIVGWLRYLLISWIHALVHDVQFLFVSTPTVGILKFKQSYCIQTHIQNGFAKTLIISVSTPTVGRLWFALGWLWLNHFVSCVDTPTIGTHSNLHSH